MPQRIEEDLRELRQSVVGLRGVIESSITEQTRVFTWMIRCMSQLMDAGGRTYQAFDSTLIESSLAASSASRDYWLMENASTAKLMDRKVLIGGAILQNQKDVQGEKKDETLTSRAPKAR
ncbi:hypothetical protein Tco_0015469, partial [Tanacetum coccineum]